MRHLHLSVSIADALTPDKREQKKGYFARQRESMYIPDRSGLIPHPTAGEANSAAIAASNALQDWARDHGIPQGEENVLVSPASRH